MWSRSSAARKPTRATCRYRTDGNCYTRNLAWRASHREALRFTALRKVSSIRDCQPGPVDLKYSITSGLRRNDTGFFVGDLFGPRPFRIEAARSGKTSANGLALAKSAFVSSGFSLTSRKSFLL